MPWNHLQIEIDPSAGLISPLYGPGGYTRTQALAEVQSQLDRAATQFPDMPLFADSAATWRRGAKDDTVFAGPFAWAVYEYPDGQDPQVGAMEWVADFARLATGQTPPWHTGADEPAAEPATGHALMVGSPYRPGRAQWPDGAAQLLLRAEGCEFVLFLARPSRSEVHAFTKGNAEFALLADDHFALWCYRFTNPKNSRNPAAQGPGIKWSDSPWERHRQEAAVPVAVPGRRGESFAVHLVLVDAGTGLVQGLRMVSPTTEFADAVRDAVDRQARTPYDSAAAARGIDTLYARHPDPTTLLTRADARFEALRDGASRNS